MALCQIVLNSRCGNVVALLPGIVAARHDEPGRIIVAKPVLVPPYRLFVRGPVCIERAQRLVPVARFPILQGSKSSNRSVPQMSLVDGERLERAVIDSDDRGAIQQRLQLRGHDLVLKQVLGERVSPRATRGLVTIRLWHLE